MKAQNVALPGLLFAYLVPFQAAVAQVSCGDTITSNATLTSDLLCSTEPGLSVENGARLDLGGHTVACTTNTLTAIDVKGDKSGVSNGTVSGCAVGIWVKPSVRFAIESGHAVSNIVAENNNTGILLGGVLRSRVTFNTLRNNRDAGIGVQGAISGRHRIAHNTLTTDASNGFDFGIYVVGSSALNTIIGNDARGFDIGIIIEDGDGTRLLNNTTSENRIGIGVFDVNETRVNGNSAEGNSFSGIEIDGDNNSVSGNMALSNGSFDLFDYNANCGTTSWQGNMFETSDPVDCIN